jgi:hypothetical protein
MAPALVGAAFSANYDGQTVGDLFDRNRTTMPPGREGQLSTQQNADLTAFLLQCNRFPSGAAELPSSQFSVLARIASPHTVAQVLGAPSHEATRALLHGPDDSPRR